MFRRFKRCSRILLCVMILTGLTIFIRSKYIPIKKHTKTKTSDKEAEAVSQDGNVLNYTIIRDVDPLAMSDYFIPRETEVNPISYKYEIRPWQLCEKDTFLVVMICSVHSHTNVRQAIRETWGSVSSTGTWPGRSAILKVKILFLFGQPKIPAMKSLVSHEDKEFNDILQGDFVDSYQNLTLKVLMGLRFVADECPQSRYVLKADEDTFTNVPLLYQFLKNVHPMNSVIGHIYTSGVAKRHGRWAVDVEIYPHHDYPHYAAGNTYVLSRDLMQCINNSSSYLPYVSIEDVFVTGIMSIVCRASLISVEGFTSWVDRAPSPEDIVSGRRITANRVSAGLANDIWREFVSSV